MKYYKTTGLGYTYNTWRTNGTGWEFYDEERKKWHFWGYVHPAVGGYLCKNLKEITKEELFIELL